MKTCLVVGISGITNGGKTTLCKHLKRDLPNASVISMDDYFFDPSSGKIPYIQELNHGNYEDPGAVDFGRLVEDVNTWVTEASNNTSKTLPQILFVEGILIFNHKALLPFFHLKYFLTLTKEQCWERRRQRSYDPPDPPGNFEKIVWPMYLKNKQSIMEQTDIVFLDGSSDHEGIYSRVVTDLKNSLDE